MAAINGKRVLKIVLLGLLLAFTLLYIALALYLLFDDRSFAPRPESRADAFSVAIVGASGTAGDGILKAVLASPDIDRIHVVTRRTTSRMEHGISSGKLRLTTHMDYLDYAAFIDQLADVDAVYWAIGTSSIGVDQETYGVIHVDFPARFLDAWVGVSNKRDASFHYISSSDISEDSSAMWAREKVRAEKSLIDIAAGTNIRVIAYRPDYIGPTQEEAHIGQDLLYWFFAPVGAAVRATAIGQAMIEVTARIEEFNNGDKLSTGKIVRYSDAYETGGT